jgi:exonuclease III
VENHGGMIAAWENILGLSETKWPGQGMKQMRKGHHIVWSGEKEEKKNGVTIILSPEMADKVTQIDYITGRIIKINLLSKGKEIEIIQVYAPQVGCTDVEKEAFTQQLQETATGEYVNIMGDFNAQVGKERNGTKIL